MEKHLFQWIPKTNQAFQQLLTHSQVQPEQQHPQYPLTWVEQLLLELPLGLVDSLPQPVPPGVSLWLGRQVPQVQLVVQLVLLLQHSAQCRLLWPPPGHEWHL